MPVFLVVPDTFAGGTDNQERFEIIDGFIGLLEIFNQPFPFGFQPFYLDASPRDAADTRVLG